MQAIDVERKNRLHANFVAALDLLDTENREPDRWEEDGLFDESGLTLEKAMELTAFPAGGPPGGGPPGGGPPPGVGGPPPGQE